LAASMPTTATPRHASTHSMRPSGTGIVEPWSSAARVLSRTATAAPAVLAGIIAPPPLDEARERPDESGAAPHREGPLRNHCRKGEQDSAHGGGTGQRRAGPLAAC